MARRSRSAPNAQLTIDKFVYDPDTKIGEEIAGQRQQGACCAWLAAKISKTNPITVVTPSSTIGIRGGICVLNIQQNNTDVDVFCSATT